MQPPFGAAQPPLDRPELPSFRFPLGAQETHQFNGVDFGPGDVWYFPRGHGHSIQGLGREPAPSCWCSTTDTFRNSAPSRSATGSATRAPEVLGRNFGLPASTFADFPKKKVYIATGPVPPPLAEDPAAVR